MNNGDTTINNFNSFLDLATKSLICDDECQKNNNENELKKKYLISKSNLHLAEPQFELARQNYYTYIYGENKYNEILEKDYQNKAQHIIDIYNNKNINDINKNIHSQIDTYNSLLTNYTNVLELFKKYTIENTELFKQVKEESNNILTNERKTYYENQEIDNLNGFYSYILFVIYYIIVICYTSFSLIYTSNYNLTIRIGLFIFLILLPFMSTWILGKIIYFIYFIIDLMPKNVYK